MIEKSVSGDLVGVNTSNPRHFGYQKPITGNKDFIKELGVSMHGALKNVNNLQTNADNLSTQMMLKPESVNVHDVVIAAQKAQLSLELTKNILQKVVQAYNTISNLR